MKKLAMSLFLLYPMTFGQIPKPNGEISSRNTAVIPFSWQAAPSTVVTPITLDASCSGTITTGGPSVALCSSAMIVTAGDTITCQASAFSFDPVSLYFLDSINGSYDNVQSIAHPGSANTRVATAMLTNSAGGSITPAVYTYEASNTNLQCQAWKSIRTSEALDNGSIWQLKSQGSAAANPTSGTAASPAYDNSVIIGSMVRPSTSSTQSGSGWSPAGTLTAAAANYAQYFEYQIQTTATAANAPFTSGSAQYTDAQFAILNTASPAGYRPFTGIFGVPAIAKSNGATTSAADLNGVTTTLASLNPGSGWTLTGTAATYDTSITPTGTRKIFVNGTSHTFGDAGTSVKLAAALTSTNYQIGTKDIIWGNPMWLSTFFRVSSTGTSNNGFCDVLLQGGGTTDPSMWMQVQYDTINGVKVFLEPYEGGSSPLLTGLSLDTDYWIQQHIAGINERYHQLLVYAKSGGNWSLSQTLNYDMLCTSAGNAACATPPTAATTTGTASSGSTALTVASGTGIVQGQIITGAGIPWLTTVESVSGTAVTLSQKTSNSLSGTAVNFYPTLTNLVTATNGTVSPGSTALTITVPSYGTITTGKAVGGVGIAQGTFVAAVSGTSVTLSQPATSDISTGGIWFFSNGSNMTSASFGKWSSCSGIGDVFMSGMAYDPTGSWGAFAPN